MSGGKHGPNRFSNYISVHNAIMGQFQSRGFILTDGLTLDMFGNDNLVLSGEIECLGGICLEVMKIIKRIEGSGANSKVQTIEYHYNARLRGRGNILRYDSPHPHRQIHHVHRFDTKNGGGETAVVEVRDGEWPTLGEVLTELEAWYYDNASWIDLT